jgi:F-type H+-transporting ATPase subunit epsilon
MFLIKVITPQSKVRLISTSILNIVTPDGEMGLLSHHMPIITMIKISRMSTVEADGRHQYAIAGGVLFFKDNEMTLLANAFESEDEIDLERALAAKERAEQRLALGGEDIDLKRAQIGLSKALNRIRVKE